MSANLKTIAAEMDRVGRQAQALAASVPGAVGGSATGVDRELAAALADAAKCMRKAAQALHSAAGSR